MPQTLDHNFFSALVGGAFRVAVAPDRSIELRLTAVTPLPPPRSFVNKAGERPPVPAMLRQQPFSMLFDGPPDLLLPQAIYRMTPASTTEPLDIFIVPIAGGPEGYTYEAIFA